MIKLLRFFQGKSNKTFTLEEFQQIVTATIGILHIFLFLIFLGNRVYFMVLVNMISIILYVIAYALSGPKHGILSFKMLYYEIIIHLILAIVMVGGDCGFCLYLLALIPVVYYFNYLFSQYEETKNKRFNPLAYSAICIFTFILLRVYSEGHEPVYPFLDSAGRELLYIINYLIVAMVLVGFMGASSVQFMTSKTKLMEYAMIDPLTSLVNRRSLLDVLNQDMKWRKKFSVILCDIDDFKKYNDTYGHEYGDLILQKIAAYLKEATRKSDVVCRWGGEEILIYLPETSKEDSSLIAEKLRKGIKKITVDGLPETVNMTFGIAETTEAKDVGAIIRLADERLYHGKEQGKDRVVWM